MKERTQTQLRVRVLEDLRTFQSPIDFRRTVEILLLGTSPQYTAGLERVTLRDSDGLTRQEKKKRQRLSGKVVAGTYHHATRSTGAHIDLFIDVIAARWPSALLRLSLLRKILLSEVLFHELGHHIQSKIVPEFKSREPTAEAWRIRLTQEFFWRKHRFLMFVLRPLAGMVKRARRRKKAQR